MNDTDGTGREGLTGRQVAALLQCIDDIAHSIVTMQGEFTSIKSIVLSVAREGKTVAMQKLEHLINDQGLEDRTQALLSSLENLVSLIPENVGKVG